MVGLLGDALATVQDCLGKGMEVSLLDMRLNLFGPARGLTLRLLLVPNSAILTLFWQPLAVLRALVESQNL